MRARAALRRRRAARRSGQRLVPAGRAAAGRRRGDADRRSPSSRPTSSSLAPATPYLLALLALAGFALGRRAPGGDACAGGWRRFGWQLAVPVIAYVAALAPVLFAGRPSFSSYGVLTDSAFHMLGADFLIRHGQDYSHLDLRNSPGQYLNDYYNTYYPSGADTFFGGSALLVRVPLIWAFQPFNAFMLALCTGPAWVLVRRLGLDGWLAALATLTVTLPALVYGYELIASVKEISSLPLILALGALVVLHPRWLRGPPRGAIPFALFVAAGVSALGVAFGAWALTAVVVLVAIAARDVASGGPRVRSVERTRACCCSRGSACSSRSSPRSAPGSSCRGRCRSPATSHRQTTRATSRTRSAPSRSSARGWSRATSTSPPAAISPPPTRWPLLTLAAAVLGAAYRRLPARVRAGRLDRADARGLARADRLRDDLGRRQGADADLAGRRAAGVGRRGRAARLRALPAGAPPAARAGGAVAGARARRRRRRLRRAAVPRLQPRADRALRRARVDRLALRRPGTGAVHRLRRILALRAPRSRRRRPRLHVSAARDRADRGTAGEPRPDPPGGAALLPADRHPPRPRCLAATRRLPPAVPGRLLRSLGTAARRGGGARARRARERDDGSVGVGDEDSRDGGRGLRSNARPSPASRSWPRRTARSSSARARRRSSRSTWRARCTPRGPSHGTGC